MNRRGKCCAHVLNIDLSKSVCNSHHVEAWKAVMTLIEDGLEELPHLIYTVIIPIEVSSTCNYCE